MTLFSKIWDLNKFKTKFWDCLWHTTVFKVIIKIDDTRYKTFGILLFQK